MKAFMMKLVSIFDQTVQNLTFQHYKKLINSGVDRSTLFSGASLVGTADIQIHKNNMFDFSESGKLSAFITPVGVRGAKNIGWYEICDLVAWHPNKKTIYRFTGDMPVLNPEASEKAFYFQQPLIVHAGLLSWLKADCEGCVVLDWSHPLFSFFSMNDRILTDDKTTGQKIKNQLACQQKLPEIFVENFVYG